MHQLVLLRHAKAAADSDTGEDFDRPLAPRGREDAPVVGKALADAGADPQVVLVSAACRTRETWGLIASNFPQAEVRFLQSLYLCAAEDLAEEAKNAGAERVMIIAHNPGMHELAARWSHRNNELETRVRAKYPTCAGTLFTRKDAEASWKLQAFVTPKTISD
ncbi:MAG TPA: histidine phosphatase family protein [Hyphomonadaceae bacterium]|nr:histidine phosphatase family protein [Hyphomonadaceae bacterium]HPN07275.1 histidine phosphatase family protein [Hyphomonadaceae bacterium]